MPNHDAGKTRFAPIRSIGKNLPPEQSPPDHDDEPQPQFLRSWNQSITAETQLTDVVGPTDTKKRIYQRAGNEPAYDLKSELYRIAGVDLTDVPGLSTLTAQTIIMEVGPDVSRFKNASAFASWLGLCPEKKVSECKVLHSQTRHVKNRAAIALRLGAFSDGTLYF